MHSQHSSYWIIKGKRQKGEFLWLSQPSCQEITVAPKPQVKWLLKAPATPDTNSWLAAPSRSPMFPCCLPEGPSSKPDTIFCLVSVLVSTKSKYPHCLGITSRDCIISFMGPASSDSTFGQLESVVADCTMWLANSELPPFSQPRCCPSLT